MRNAYIFLFVGIFSLFASAQRTVALDMESQKEAVIDVVEEFLTAAGNYDLDAIPEMFSEKANIAGASLRDGEWITYTMTIQEFMEHLQSRENPTKYSEPVSEYTIHMEKRMLAFVKADAILIKNGIPRRNNFDYFTLIKENGEWKILYGSYVSIPIEDQHSGI